MPTRDDVGTRFVLVAVAPASAAWHPNGLSEATNKSRPTGGQIVTTTIREWLLP